MDGNLLESSEENRLANANVKISCWTCEQASNNNSLNLVLLAYVVHNEKVLRARAYETLE